VRMSKNSSIPAGAGARTYSHANAPLPTPPAPPGVIISTIAMGDLERGEGEWKNMQTVVRRSFKDCIDRLNGHQTSLDHLSQVILGVNDKLASRVSTQDVIKLLEKEDFAKKIKQDGHFQDRLDKLEYSITKVAALKSELDKKSDISYVDTICSRKLEKTDVSIRALLSETVKGDVSSLRGEVRDILKKIGVQETLQAQLQHSHDMHGNTLHEMQALARELKGMKDRLDSYPSFSQLLSILDRKADKSAVEATTLAHSRDTRSNIHTSSGTGSSTGADLGRDLDAMQRSINLHSVQLETLLSQRDQNVEDVLDRGMGVRVGVGGAGITPIKARREDVRFDVDGEISPPRLGGRSGNVTTTGSNSNSNSASASASAQLTNSDMSVLLAKMDSLALDVHALRSDNKTLRDKIFVLESQAHREKEIGLASTTATITGTGTAAVAAGMQNTLNKIGAATIKAETAANKAAKRVSVVESITQQRLDSVDHRISTMMNKIATIGDAVKTVAKGKKEKEIDTDKRSKAVASVPFITGEESTIAVSMRLKEQQYHLQILSSRVDSLESSVTHANARLMDHTAQLAALPVLAPPSPSPGFSPGGTNRPGVYGNSLSGADSWETWRASVLDQVKNNAKQFREEMQKMQEAIVSIGIPSSKEARHASVAAHVTAMGLASSAHTRAEEAMDAVRLLRATQQLSSNQSSPTGNAMTADSQANGNWHPTQHRLPAQVWIGDHNYPIYSSNTSPSNEIEHSSPSDVAAAHWAARLISPPKTPLSATSAALDARLARLQRDKEDLRNLTRQHMQTFSQHSNF